MLTVVRNFFEITVLVFPPILEASLLASDVMVKCKGSNPITGPNAVVGEGMEALVIPFKDQPFEPCQTRHSYLLFDSAPPDHWCIGWPESQNRREDPQQCVESQAWVASNSSLNNFLFRMAPRHLARSVSSCNSSSIIRRAAQHHSRRDSTPLCNNSSKYGISFGSRYVPVTYHMAGPFNYGYGDSLSSHRRLDHFTGCMIEYHLNLEPWKGRKTSRST